MVTYRKLSLATKHDAFGSMAPGATDWTGTFGGRITLAH